MSYTLSHISQTRTFVAKMSRFVAAIVVALFVTVPAAVAEPTSEAILEQLRNANWRLAFEDECTQDWRKNWTLNSEEASITHSPQGMDFRAGPTWKDNACHAVLWTKRSFQGDIKVDYAYTRTDRAARAATIVYVQATGSGEPPYERDIAAWADLRKVPAMSTYRSNMNSCHISYAAFGSSKDNLTADYIRSRRYRPGPKSSLKGTELAPYYFEAGLFDTGVPHMITVIKAGDELFMRVRNDDRTVSL